MKAVVVEMSIGPLVVRLTSRDIPENTRPDGTVMGILEAAKASGTLPQLMEEITAGIECALAIYVTVIERPA